MAQMRYGKPDANQGQIVKDLRAYGAKVSLLTGVGRDVPDLLVGYRGMNFLLEVKADGGKLSKGQVEWHKTWLGQCAVVRTSEEAIAVITNGEIAEK